jgi:hypothetical protein
MKTIEYRTIDKSAWPRGEWDDEPDKKQWTDPETGLPCIALRHVEWGNWCGYVGVPTTHPLHGKSYDEPDLEVHGGLTFAGPYQHDPCPFCVGRLGRVVTTCEDCQGSGFVPTSSTGICHVPDAGEPDNVWWFGFDCHHAFDRAPGFRLDLPAGLQLQLFKDAHYRNLAYVEAETTRLAQQLASLQKRGS